MVIQLQNNSINTQPKRGVTNTTGETM